MTDPRIIVLAGNADEFKSYISDKCIPPTEAVYMAAPLTMLGRCAEVIVVTGTFYGRKDCWELLEAAREAVRPERAAW